MIRIGEGYDVHQLVEDRDLILGGIKIPYEKGLKGHSDADALLHAITDALLGSCALGDIGQHFPDTDPQYKGADSALLLKDAYRLVQDLGFYIVNIDCTIIAQQPKMKDWILPIRQNIAHILNIDFQNINVKAKTNEKLGYLGECKAIETRVALLVSND